MTTDITELAQREKFEAWAEECNALPWGYLKKLRIYTGFYSDHTYTSLWAAWKAAGAELVEALEKAQQVDEELCRLLPPGAEYMDPPDGGDVTPLEGVRRMVADYRQRIAELESRTVKLPLSFTQSVSLSGRRTTALPISPCSSFSRSVKLSEAMSTRLVGFAGYGMVKRSAS